jgi:hypothetical protein
MQIPHLILSGRYYDAPHLYSLRQTFIDIMRQRRIIFIAAGPHNICSRKAFKNLSKGAEHRNI